MRNIRWVISGRKPPRSEGGSYINALAIRLAYYLPTCIPMTSNEQPLDVATKWLASLRGAVDAKAFADHFLPTGWLRDLLCFSWDFKSTAGRGKIAEFLSEPSGPNGKSRFQQAGLRDFELDKSILPAKFEVPGNPPLEGMSAAFTFAISSPPAIGRGFVRLLSDEDGVWRAFTLFTNMQDLVGHEEPTEGIEGYFGTTWEDEYAKKMAEIENDPTVLIVGGGQGGLMCAARFGRMGIRSLVVEKTARVGDVWRNRYPNLSLHTTIHPSTVLYQPWPKTYPKFLPRDKIADFLEGYAVGQELNVWLSSTVLPTPTYDPSTGRWTVEIDRAGKRVCITPKHIVFATGIGAPKAPSWPGMDSFAGTMYHSDKHRGAAPFKGKRVVVVGACNAGSDIAEDFVVKGAAEVTMVQRSATCVFSSSTYEKFSPPGDKLPIVEDMDLVNNSMPPALNVELANRGLESFKDCDRELFDGLQKAGFKLTWQMNPGGPEVSPLAFFYNRIASGTMLDMGNAQLIVDGNIKIKQGVEIERIESAGLVFVDGSKLEADVIVLATGYYPIIKSVASIMGEGIKDLIGQHIFGLDEPGLELKNCYRPTGAPGVWVTPGAFPQARFLSKHLAIQIKAEELGLKTRA
ncbi:FAD/NAD(P)-binding domain-containing protein [Roridomyces roridus]|uniref:FAD/NAD(P)-binding domain-containing protein n=1 Tax=Roridomyces roridus TaxID=1738132 RepID=A0AAD7FC75_9AGAR|nr:FAD/NAD(P)-binding domain-containing protein [Roridomyces roridus]